MKYKLHIPTEQYGYIEAELEGEPTDAVKKYHEIRDAYHEPQKKQKEKRADIEAETELDIGLEVEHEGNN